MEEFVSGQRWINEAELSLGLGTVIEIESRTVTLHFASIEESRTYAIQSAPLTRIQFEPGDTIQTRDGLQIKIESVSEEEGLLSYLGQDKNGTRHQIDEILLDDRISLNRPAERLFSGQIDLDKWFTLRTQALEEKYRLGLSPLRGLTGCRTSLIPHQLYIASEISQRHSPRVLLADEVGLGKTIEAGLIIHKKLLDEQIQRVLIVVPETLLHQWLVEMLRRFNLHFRIFDEDRIQDDPDSDEHINPFLDEQLILCSQEFISGDKNTLESAASGNWDLLVVDEAHHLHWSPDKTSPEYSAIETLAARSKGLLLLTATPEQLGKSGHFARLRLLDPSRFPDFDSFIEEENKYEPVAGAINELFEENAIHTGIYEKLSEIIEDQAFLQAVKDGKQSSDDVIHHLLDRHGTGRVLYRNTRNTVKGFPQRNIITYPLNYPEQYKSVGNHGQTSEHLLSPEIRYRQYKDEKTSDWCHFDPRVNWLQNKLEELKPAKVLIITASEESVLQIAEYFRIRTGMHLPVFHQGMSIIERDRAAAFFADEEDGAQALLCSEIGSEGRNFQFSHHLVLFDLPLNPDLMEQRIGRLDRIGQEETINIHIPLLRESAQERIFRWFNVGLDIFTRPRPAASKVFTDMYTELVSILADPKVDMNELLADTRNRMQTLNLQLEKGRDKLLEFNSCIPERANYLKNLAIDEDRNSTLALFMERVFDCFGVHTEEHSAGQYIIRPAENMLSAFPLLEEEGMTITYERRVALSNEDVHFLSWDHPMVAHAIDFVLGSELGNTAVIAFESEDHDEGSLLLECQFILESGSGMNLNTSRYLPSTGFHMMIDESLTDHKESVSSKDVSKCSENVDRQTAGQIIKMKQNELKKMLSYCESKVRSETPIILSRAVESASEILNHEIERLLSLGKVNKNVRDDEIRYLEEQKRLIVSALGNAGIRLDSLRVIITT